MRVVIQDPKSGRFLNDTGHWIPTRDEAFGFENSLAAIEHCQQRHLFDVCIRLCFPDPDYDIMLMHGPEGIVPLSRETPRPA